jgi:zinc transport system substrate-binding protein
VVPGPRSRLAVLVAVLVLALSGCGTSQASNDTNGIPVVASFYPMAWAVQAVGGDRVAVSTLTPAGAEPHDVELTPQQVAEVSSAELVVYVSGFQPSVDEAVAQSQAASVDAGAIARKDYPGGIAPGQPGFTGTDVDPHLWLDPVNMVTVVQAVRDELTSLDPSGAADYKANAEATIGRLVVLDRAWSAGTATCRNRDLVVSHEAFGYLAQRYGFTQIGITGLSPDAEPSPARLAEVADVVRNHHVSTIYYETLVDPKIADTLAQETGAQTAKLDPLESGPTTVGADYIDVMNENLRTLQAGQGCS